jgi:hypothetical protein
MEKEIEQLLNELGDNFRELVRHYSTNEWTAAGVPRVATGSKRKEWKPKAILRGGKTPNEALEKLLKVIKDEK